MTLTLLVVLSSFKLPFGFHDTILSWLVSCLWNPGPFVSSSSFLHPLNVRVSQVSESDISFFNQASKV